VNSLYDDPKYKYHKDHIKYLTEDSNKFIEWLEGLKIIVGSKVP